MESGAHPYPFARLCFPDSKQVPIYCWVEKEFSSRRIAKPRFELTTSRRFSASLPHNRAALTTRSRHFFSFKFVLFFKLMSKSRFIESPGH